MNKLIFASHNVNKVKELQNILKNSNSKLEVLSCNDINFKEAEETGTTFEENALLKARQAYNETKIPAIADDSGFAVKALNGAPGVYSARFAKELGSYENAFNKLEQDTKQFEDKQASFICVIAFCNKDQELVFKGEVKGTLNFPAKGSNGFGYDAIFTPDGYNKTFAELDENIKNSISHRKQALSKFLNFITKN